jgi:O-succinylbenzoic acid--CoA ligase
VGGLSILLRSAIYGTTAEVHQRFDAGAVNRAIDRGVTIVSLVSVMLQRLLEERGDAPFPPSLRCLLIGGGPVPAPLLERCLRMGAPVVQTYGLTECCSQVATLAPEDALTHLGSAGRALYPNELRIAVAPDSPDDAGEILVRGPIVMSGYLGDPDATAQALNDGWMHTGDIGRLDADGYLYMLDRRDDLIVSGGENVYPAEVEGALLEHPWVEEAAVIGAPDATWGHRVVAVVRLRSELQSSATDAADALRAYCRERLAAYKAPAEVRIVTESLPRTESGKIRRAALRG